MEAASLNPHALAVMALTFFALFLFSRRSIPIETSSLSVVAILTIGFTIFPYDLKGGEIDVANFLNGFSNEALIAICALMMASEGLVRTGALAPVGRLVARHWNKAPMFAFLAMLIVTAIVSAFMNNTPQVVLMIPLLIGVAVKSGMPSSKTLMPMTFSAQMGGMATPIGTSLNLLVISSAAALGVKEFHMFDFFVPASIAGSIGILYLWLVAPRLLPERKPRMPDTSPRIFTAQLKVAEDSFADGKKLSDAIKSGTRAKISSLKRSGGLTIAALPDVTLRAGDMLLVQDTPEGLKELEKALGGTLYVNDHEIDDENPLEDKDQQLAELVVTRNSFLLGRTLKEVHFDEEYDLIPLAIHRADNQAVKVKKDLHNIRLRTGDVILVQAGKAHIEDIKRSGKMLVLDASTVLPETSKAPLTLLIMGAIVLLASLKILSVASAAICGVLVMILTRCVTWQDAIRALDSQMIFLTVASIALSFAMVQTGAAQWLAYEFVSVTSGLPGEYIISGLILFMALLSNLISNSAAAVIGTPIAVKIAQTMDYSPDAFVLAVLFGVNMSYATPMADNCNLLVYSAGGYKFSDFMRVGIPLTLIMWAAYSLLLPHFFPL